MSAAARRPAGGRARKPLPLHERALGLLAVRQRSVREMRTRLLSAGFEPAEVDAEIATLLEVGLLDDAAFARAAAEQALGRRHEGRRSVASTLRIRGVDPTLAQRTIEEVDDQGDEARAVEFARQRASRMTGDPTAVRRRLMGQLQRRGFSQGVAWRAVAAAITADDVTPDAD